MRRLTFMILLISLVLSFSVSQVKAEGADTVITVLDAARDAYARNEYRRTITQLQRAISLIQGQLIKELEQYFPKPFGDWEEMSTQENSSASISGAALSVKKLFYHRKTSASVEIEFAIDRTKAANFKTWLANPLEMRSSSQAAEIVTIAGKRFVAEFDKTGKHGELSLVLGASAIVRIVGDNIKDLEHLRLFAERIDYDALREILR
jgi:hypothetical protein